MALVVTSRISFYLDPPYLAGAPVFEIVNFRAVTAAPVDFPPSSRMVGAEGCQDLFIFHLHFAYPAARKSLPMRNLP